MSGVSSVLLSLSLARRNAEQPLRAMLLQAVVAIGAAASLAAAGAFGVGLSVSIGAVAGCAVLLFRNASAHAALSTVIEIMLLSAVAIVIALLVPVPTNLGGTTIAVLASGGAWLLLAALVLRDELSRLRVLLMRNLRIAR